jgi:hypothetical protein
MSWLYSRALVEEFLVDICLDGEQSAQLSGNPTQQAFCAPDKMMDFSRLSRFGMTYKPLMADRGQELLTLYLAAFHAKTSAQQEKGQELMGSEAECGEKWRGSFVKYDPNSSLWRTHQCSLLGDLDEFLETWPQWGLMRDGECWEQRTLEQTIRGTEFGLSENKWPTPTASQARSEGMILQMRQLVECGTTTIEEAEAMIGGSLTPKRMKNWPTPDASPRGPTKDYDPKAKSQSGRTLQSFAAKYPNTEHPTSGQLNPTWVEWLMGWPLGWTDLKPLETGKSHCVQQQPGAY